jgi:hypothetical protein
VRKQKSLGGRKKLKETPRKTALIKSFLLFDNRPIPLLLPAIAARRVSRCTCISIHVRGDELKADVFFKKQRSTFFLIGKIRGEKKNQRHDTVDIIN